MLLNSSSRIIFFYSFQTLIPVSTHTLNENYFCSSTGTGPQFVVIPKKVGLIFGLNGHQFLTEIYRNLLWHILCLSLHHLSYCPFVREKYTLEKVSENGRSYGSKVCLWNRAFCLVWAVQRFIPYNHRVTVGSSYTTYRCTSSAPSVLTVSIQKQLFFIKFSVPS